MTIRTTLIFFICIVTFFSFQACNERQAKKKTTQEVKQDSLHPNYKKPASGSSDTLFIDKSSAVFFKPDSAQLGELKKILPAMNFDSDQHNCFYQMRNARMVIGKYWPRVHIIDASKTRYLLFIKSDKTTTCIDLDSKGDSCGIFLFDPAKEPELTDMMNIDTGLGFYFGK